MELQTTKKWVKKLLLFGFVFTAVTMLNVSGGRAEENPTMKWTAADMLSAESGISVLRYGHFGLGAYPWKTSMPGPVMKVRIDGVPLFGLSPFGPDLDLVPAVFIDSVYHSGNMISIKTKTSDSENPVTTTDFFQGAKQRFRFQVSFQKKLSDVSGFFIGGASNGMHGSQGMEASSFRSYFLKYRRSLNEGGNLFFSARAFRDRDGLRNMKDLTHMGNRETDALIVSLGIQELPFTGRTSLSPMVYYRDGISRIRRYGSAGSLEDNAFGFSLTSSTKYDTSVVDVSLTSDVRSIDSELHENSWKRDETGLSVSWQKTGSRFRYGLKGSALYASEYGAGGTGEAEIVYPVASSYELFAKGSVSQEPPDTGIEFYPALEFSDSTVMGYVDMFRYNELNIGISGFRDYFTWRLSGFRTGTNNPQFSPETFVYSKGNENTCSGFSLFLSTDGNERYYSDIDIHYSNSAHSKNTFPYPDFEIISHSRVKRNFLNEKLHACLFGTLRISQWDNNLMSPDGATLFLHGGISVNVMKLSLFYRVENVTGGDAKFFNYYSWPGINSIWGIRWQIDN